MEQQEERAAASGVVERPPTENAKEREWEDARREAYDSVYVIPTEETAVAGTARRRTGVRVVLALVAVCLIAGGALLAIQMRGTGGHHAASPAGSRHAASPQPVMNWRFTPLAQHPTQVILIVINPSPGAVTVDVRVPAGGTGRRWHQRVPGGQEMDIVLPSGLESGSAAVHASGGVLSQRLVMDASGIHPAYGVPGGVSGR
jgi:hypothetical protein